MSSGRRKKTETQKRNNQSLIDIISSISEFNNIKELEREEGFELVAFKFNEVNLILEKRVASRIIVMRLMNSFNTNAMKIGKDKQSLLSIANNFNRKSIGIKSTIIEEEQTPLIVFTVEEIAVDEKMLNLSGDSLRMLAAILAGAPTLFEKLGMAKD
ncbi:MULTISPECIES: hypothetical protein [Enterobacteriaceae]|jgi:hypothetical protein|nr:MULTISPECIES: hypothetical protein [Enterobacteriaceae]DAP13154.1 MAG TPA: hypothetical protein [Caudoviricetes sp.]ESA74524.1 hypothetical protein HMPREF1592_03677 [Escherichia coli 907357]MCA2167362.1 hypothetical protein [Escherichia coli]MCA6820487.1 hypothetical protein [Escherichia coli]MCA7415616.1 hypothetical protein [Escherichia coli]